VASLVDRATLDDPGHVLVHIDGPVHPEVALGLKALDPGVHPFDVLAGFTAPESWTAFGIRARGRAHHLEDPRSPVERTAVTFLLDRHGQEASMMRVGDDVEELCGPATGTIPDLCRRVLGLPTPPAPPSTAPLWTCTWLDRVLERWGQPRQRRALTTTWGRIAVLHPAVHAPNEPDVVAFADPASLVTVARSHAAACSWEQLRRSPVPLALPEGALPRDVALWMDDGFFARWAIGAYPPVSTLAGDLRELLGEPLGPQLLEVVAALLD
jgi:hypothetical protein